MRYSPAVDRIIGAAIQVHKSLGPGLFESIYETSLAHELHLRHVSFVRQAAVPAVYRGIDLGCAYRVDFVVEQTVALELKSVETILPVHDAQVLTYMRLLKLSHGLLINFNAVRLMDGLKSFVL